MTAPVATPSEPIPGPLADPDATAPCANCGRPIYRCFIGMGPLYRHVDTEYALCSAGRNEP